MWIVLVTLSHHAQAPQRVPVLSLLGLFPNYVPYPRGGRRVFLPGSAAYDPGGIRDREKCRHLKAGICIDALVLPSSVLSSLVVLEPAARCGRCKLPCAAVPVDLELCTLQASYHGRVSTQIHTGSFGWNLGRRLDYCVCANGFVEQDSDDQIPNWKEGLISVMCPFFYRRSSESPLS
jgi:hypothetical protein